MLQYTHDYSFIVASKKTKLYSHQINDTSNNIASGVINDKDYIGMSHDSSISFDIGVIKPNEEKTLEIFIWINENNENSNNDNRKSIKKQRNG